VKKLNLRPPAQRFPGGFLWGVAAAAPQIEGAGQADGKGESVWDHFARKRGKVRHGHNLDVACDHYHRYKSDFALMRELGVKHYRLSTAWPRLFPDGDGDLNRKGLDFYRRLIDAMHDAGITPWVTLFHWDLPQSLERRFGGWRSRRTVDAFRHYADTLVAGLADRVKLWFTVNEIRCFTTYCYGPPYNKAPGVRATPAELNQSVHHALLAHGHAVQAVREHGGRGARVGIAENITGTIPVTETPGDIAAARQAFDEQNAHVLGAICTGDYSRRYLRATGANRPKVARGDFDIITTPTDFIGLNLYSAPFYRAGKNGRPERLPFPEHYPASVSSPWLRLTPQFLYWGPRFVTELYGAREILITENGLGHFERPLPDGEVVDLHRREYLRQCLGELRRAIGDRVPVRGYFAWSFMDNFEWFEGYDTRFGLCYTDYRTQRRRPKLSARWYAEVMRSNHLV
jgi:beta-glucosidase